MGSYQQEREADSQTLSLQETANCTGSWMEEKQAVSEHVHEYVCLSDLELIASPRQPIFTNRPFVIPSSTFMTSKAHGSSEKGDDANASTQAKIPSCPTASVGIPTQVSGANLEMLWREPEVDLSRVTPTSEELAKYGGERDGLAHTTTGPSCSVCDSPLSFEVLMDGMSCDVCGFM
jgi:hypothetical protein